MFQPDYAGLVQVTTTAVAENGSYKATTVSL